MVIKDAGIEKIIREVIEDISEVCTTMRDKYLDEYENEILLAAALQASLTFSVSTLIAAGVSEVKAHEALNKYYTQLMPDIEKIMDQERKKN